MQPKANAAAGATRPRKLFGTDGIRGVANEHPMTPELALQLGRAVTFVAGRGKSHVPRIVLGKDTRLSGYMLEQAIASGICAMGGRVMLCGPVPTPAIAHLTVSEAVMRMELADQPVLMFRDMNSGVLNVVYRRPDGQIGWIDPGE